MNKAIAAAGVIAVVALGGATACGSSSNDSGDTTVSSSTEKKTPVEPKEDAAPAEPATQAVPTLKVGQTVHVQTTEYGENYQGASQGTADVTLKSVKEYTAADFANDLVSPELTKNQEVAVVTLKIENTGSGELSTLPYSGTQTWTGKDGQVASVMITSLDETYVSQDLADADSLQPGEHIEGGSIVIIPKTQPGKLHFQDDSGKRMFDVTTQGVQGGASQ